VKQGAFVWNELLTRDVEGAKRFYATLAGWTYKPMAMPGGGTYWVAERDGQAKGGIMAMPAELPATVPAHWFEYLEVADVDATVRTACANGGKEIHPAMDIPDVGRIGFIEDPTGARLGLLTPVPRK
jgi:hypothetical protein